jgi:hypothetical protein
MLKLNDVTVHQELRFFVKVLQDTNFKSYLLLDPFPCFDHTTLIFFICLFMGILLCKVIRMRNLNFLFHAAHHFFS